MVGGRERIYLDCFYNELSANPKAIETLSLRRTLCAPPRYARRVRAVRLGKLTMPVPAVGAEKSFTTAMADDIRFDATNATGSVVANSGHWLIEEQPARPLKSFEAFSRRNKSGRHSTTSDIGPLQLSRLCKVTAAQSPSPIST